MDFITHNDTNKWMASGTSLQGYIVVSYDTLVELFGEPTEGDGYKTDAEWTIKWEDGTVTTIYNWKNGKNYNSEEYDGDGGTFTEEIVDWNVGGKGSKSVELLYDHMKENKKGWVNPNRELYI